MTDLITAEVVKLREIAVSEKELSNAYLRIRAKLQAWDTKPGGVDRFEITEAALDRLTAELAAANAREAGLRDALDMSHQGWRNALELDLLPKQHRHSAKTMADIAAAALASRPTEYEQKVAKMKEDFPNGI